jgi:hypothetical protein
VTEPRLSDRELEAALRDLGAHLSYPASHDLLPAVRARIEEDRGAGFWSIFRAPRVAFIPAVATVVLILVVALAFQPAGANALEALGIRGLTVFRGTEVPPATRGSAILPDARRVRSVADASREAGFAVVVPAALGAPDELYVRTTPDGGSQVFLVYGRASGIAPSRETGISVLIIEAAGGLQPSLIGKFLPPDGRSGQQMVNGGFGVWIEGKPHQIFFRAPNGEILTDSVRLAGNVLAWEQGPLFLRIEADISREEALRIAASMR